MPKVAESLDKMLRTELTSGFNALSATGDYLEIDVFAKAQQQALYRRFYLDEAQLNQRYDDLLACEVARANLTIAEFVHADPELEAPCAADLLADPLSPRDVLDSRPSKKLLTLFKKAYAGFDEATDWPKVEAWVVADPKA